ncbi:ankyrin repeat domain-containing protein [Noviherbaspirillum sp. Root189]|uniref:ankyrin repeat domain-containing protein n=1 Tax=Noviherbaspirillum sp. Root189 TaxID=1736487 RepID=UPI00071022BE|nr:ankyrin repeat domain-containing protein [Noviherbaspirillum sp. Root189]KRB70962.1 hypothetical protein ASE07_27290 [Noviherbaspirillum sp. Root189]
MTDSINSSRSASPIPMTNVVDDIPDGQNVAGSASTLHQPVSDPNQPILGLHRRGSAVWLAAQAAQAESSNSAVTSNVNGLNEHGNTPLFQAFEDGDIGKFKSLLQDSSVDVNKPNKYGHSALLAACMGKFHLGIGPERMLVYVEELLKRTDIQVNATNPIGLTPIHAACRQKAPCSVTALLGAPGIDVNLATTNDGRTPLHSACDAHQIEIVEALLKTPDIKIDVKDRENKTPFDLAFEQGNEKIMTALLKHGDVYDTEDKGLALLQRLLEKDYAQAITALLERDPTLALAKGIGGNTLLHIAARNNKQEVVTTILNFVGVDAANEINDGGHTPFIFACTYGHLGIVNEMLKLPGLDVNSQDNDGNNALHFAAMKGKRFVVEILLKSRSGTTPTIDPNAKTNSGDTAFGLALKSGKLEIVRAMLNHPYSLNEQGRLTAGSIDPNEPDAHFQSPLAQAVVRMSSGELPPTTKKDYLDLVKALLNDPRVDPNQALLCLTSMNGEFSEKIKDSLNRLHHPVTRASWVSVLKTWAQTRPVGVAQNLAPAARTNFQLGKILQRFVETEHAAELIEANGGKGAVFQFSLALEQLLKHPEQVQRIMRQGDTVAVDRIHSISNYARVLLDAVSKEDKLRNEEQEPPPQIIWNRRIEPFSMNFPGASAEIQYEATLDVSELTIADADLKPTGGLNLGGICVPREDIQDLAEGRGFKAMQLALIADERVEAERNVHQIGHLMTGVAMLSAVREKNLEMLVRLNEAASSGDAVQAHVIPDFAVAAKEVLAAIARASNASPSDAMQTRLDDVGAAIDEIAHMPDGGAVNERNLTTTVQDVFREMWFYIRNKPDDMRQNLEEAFFIQLQDMWYKRSGGPPTFSCYTGCVQRILATPHHIDPELISRTPDRKTMDDALLELAKGVLQPIRMAYEVAGDADALDTEEHLAKEREIFEATAREVLIGFRGWEGSLALSEAIEAMKENIVYVNVLPEDKDEV